MISSVVLTSEKALLKAFTKVCENPTEAGKTARKPAANKYVPKRTMTTNKCTPKK